MDVVALNFHDTYWEFCCNSAFSFLKGILNQHQFLEGPEGTGNARFGSAIAALSDINMDGFNDVIVGSPVENENSGAVYIYNGHQGTIHTKYSQVTMNDVLGI